jgi:tRNA (guanine37-N1)-methyltransferase
MNLKKTLEAFIPEDDLKRLIRGFDIIGDIAVVIIAEGLEQYEQLIADAILAIHKNVTTVFKRDGNYSGEYRTIPLALIAGERKTETLCREFGVRLLLDVEKVYFSVRSGHERKRIADLICPGENVLVMFSGVAPYPLMISRYSEAAKITGIEINETAHHYGVRNLSLNKARNIVLVHDDVVSAVDRSAEKYDRIIMPLPYGAGDFLESAVRALLPGGTLHFYDFKCSCNFDKSAQLISIQAAALGRTVTSAKIVLCGHASPQLYRICVDALIS